MNMNDLLIEAHKHLDAATVENENGSESMCMYHLGGLHGLLICFLETKEPKPWDVNESSNEH